MTVEIENLTRTVTDADTPDIRSINLRLPRGTASVLLGSKPAGLGILCGVLAGHYAPTFGRVLVDGKVVTGSGAGERRVVLVDQLLKDTAAKTVFAVIAAAVGGRRMAKAEREARVRKAAAQLGVGAHLDRRLRELSDGERQRVALASAFVSGAGLVILEAPAEGLAAGLCDDVATICAETGTVFLYATENAGEALQIDRHTATLWDGCITAFGGARNLHQRPPDIATARVLCDPPNNEVHVRKVERELRRPGMMPLRASWPLTAFADADYTLAIRPDDVTVNSAADRRFIARSDLLVLPARVATPPVTPAAGYMSTRDGRRDWIVRVPAGKTFAPGDEVDLVIDPARMIVFDDMGALVAAPAFAMPG